MLRADNADRQMSVYLSSPSCPAFLPLLHGLLTASLLPQPTSGAEMMSTRMTCAMALVRFVNGMVDPLQTGKVEDSGQLSFILTIRLIRSPNHASRRIYRATSDAHCYTTSSNT